MTVIKVNYEMKDGTIIEFISQPTFRDDFFVCVKFKKKGKNLFGIAFDEKSYREFLCNFIKLF